MSRRFLTAILSRSALPVTAHGSHSEHALAFVGSTVFSLTAILVLAFLERRRRGLPEGRLGTAYVVGAALRVMVSLTVLPLAGAVSDT